jgi:two-component system response regulator QseB
MRVLLVEDDPMIGESVQQGVRQDGFAVDWVQDGEAATLALRTTAYVLVLLALGLPRKTGLQVLTTLQRTGQAIPGLIVTARDAVADRVQGLDNGADDSLVKPFALAELAARMRALLRRQCGGAKPLLVYGDLRLNPATHHVL